MATNYFRNNPTNNAIGVLQSRRGVWREGRNSLHVRTARNNAWCSVTIDGLSLPAKSETFDKLYGRGLSSPKPYPSLESISIQTAGQWGHAIHVEVSFTCYLRSDFEKFDKVWMRPGAEGSVSFGYVKPINGSEQKYNKLDGLVVATFEFSTDQNAHYHCRLKMVGASKFAEAAEVKGGLKDRGSFKYKTKSLLGGSQSHEVTSLDELLLYDAQENGSTSTDDMADNHKVPTPFGDIIVYHPPDKAGLAGGIQRVGGKVLGALANMGDKQWTYHHEYYSLEYVVNRLVNDQILGFLKENTSSKDRAVIGTVKVICDSQTSVGVGYDVIRSADPLSMLILGGGRGTYLSGTGQGKDWENGGEGAGASISCYKGNEVDLSKIMLERMTITSALSHARVDSEESDKSTQTGATSKTQVLIYVERFLKELFKTISFNTGNLFQLDLVENPENRKELLVVDRNNGVTDTLQVFMFDPIDGDGSTRDMSISSGGGNKDYMAAMFGAVHKQSDINSTIKGDIAEVDNNRAKKFQSIPNAINEKVTKSLPDGGFAADEIEGLRTLIMESNQVLPSDDNKRKQVILYPGLKLSVTLDGVWGFGIGNHIHTTLLPKDPYRITSNGICFNVQDVSHTIQNNDWETRLEAILTFAKPIQYV
jgi:hypothetical protein